MNLKGRACRVWPPLVQPGPAGTPPGGIQKAECIVDPPTQLHGSMKASLFFRLSFGYFTSFWRATPDFIIIGTSKSGTGSLWRYLRRHPQIAGSFPLKETGYFARRYRLGFTWYKANFPVRKKGVKYFEATPSYLMHPEAAERIHAYNPATRLIVLFRNPVDRAYSNYLHGRRVGARRAQRPFAEIIDEQVDHYNPADFDTSGSSHVHFGYVHPGCYMTHLKHWLKYFPREQIKIIISDDMFRDTQGALNEMFEFVGVPPHPIEDLVAYNTNTYEEPMPPETRAKLREFFRPYNEELFQFLGKRYDWE